jgi:hypothetical protein
MEGVSVLAQRSTAESDKEKQDHAQQGKSLATVYASVNPNWEKGGGQGMALNPSASNNFTDFPAAGKN